MKTISSRQPLKWALIISIILAFSLAGNAFAEGELPPETPVETNPEIEESPTEIIDPLPEPSPDESLPEIPPVLTEESPEEIVLTENLIEENTPAPTEVEEVVMQPETLTDEPLAEVIEDLANLEISLADESGDILELASTESAEALAVADPYFTVGTIVYSFTTTDCNPAIAGNQPCANPITAAINFIMNTGLIPTDRKIYVESGTYNESVVIDGTLPFLNQLKGLIGMKTGSNLPAVNGSIYIHDTLFGFTLSGFTINATAGSNGAVRVASNTGTLVLKDLTVRNTNGPGINVTNHTGAVNLTNVISSDNFGSGALITNINGIFPVTVNNSEFDQNDDGGGTGANNGLWIYSKGLVTLNNVSASSNDGRGVYIDTDKTVTIKNSMFSLNYSNPNNPAYGYGLWIWTDYPTNHVTLENVQADNNTASGFYLIIGGNLNAKKIGAVNNSGSGAFFSVDGTVSVSASTFTDNSNDGLRVDGLKSITLNSIEASRNTGYGTYLNNCQYSGSACLGSGTVQVIGTPPNQFIDNGSTGLYILSSGAVILTNFEASDNTSLGVYILNDYAGISAGVTINANYVPAFGTFTNIIHQNGTTGLRVYSFGNISIDKVWALNNPNDGISLYNDGALTAKTVTIKNSEAWENTGTGIEISSLGSITVTNCASHDNGYYGLYIDNTSGTGNVTISATTIKDFSGNISYAISVTSRGSISVNHIDGSDSLWGTSINNQTATSAKPLTLTDGVFSDTANTSGLSVTSLGLITLRNITAENNANYGIYADNQNAASAQAVVISSISVIDNDSDGIEVYSKGNVTINNIISNENGYIGLYVDTCQYNGSECLGIGSVTMSGIWNEFTGNVSTAINIISGGNILLSNFSALYNENGVIAANNISGETGSITITASTGKYNEARWNDGYGIYLQSLGAISVSRSTVDDNTTYGGYLSNHQALSAKSVTITDCSFSHNQYDGLYIGSKGTVTLKAVTANGNTRYNSSISSGSTHHDTFSAESYMYEGGRWESYWYNGSGVVNIQLRSAEFIPQVFLYDDYGHMLAWDENTGNLSDAFITAFLLPAAGNYRIEVAAKDSGYGIYDLALNNPIGSITNYHIYMGGINLDNTFGSADIIVLPLGSKTNSFSFNGYIGARVYSYGNISFSKAEGHYNFSDGFSVHNSSAPLAKNVTFTNVTANNNYYSGIFTTSLGLINWNGGGATGNGSNGGSLDNSDAATPKPATVSNALFNLNRGSNGLRIDSLGTITITNTTASDNDSIWGYGVYLDNCQYSGSACTGSGNITVNGLFGGEGYNDNGYCGIYADTFGSIRVQNTEAMGNGDFGAALYNNYSGSIGSVTVIGTNSNPANFSENINNDGLRINSRGAVTLTNVRSDENANGSGVIIYNNDVLTPLSVTLNRIFANDNRYAGIYLESHGAVNATSLQTNRNQSLGTGFTNNGALTAQVVTVTKSEFLENLGNGLEILSAGKVTLNNIRSNNNTADGLYVNTTGDLAILSTLGENFFNINSDSGIYVVNAKNITLSKVTVNNNDDLGIYVGSAATLSISTGSIFRNGEEGINATLSGDAVLSNLMIVNNGISGANYDGIYLSTAPASVVKILGCIITGHVGSGIDLNGASALILDGSFYYGNDTNNDGQPNVDWS